MVWGNGNTRVSRALKPFGNGARSTGTTASRVEAGGRGRRNSVSAGREDYKIKGSVNANLSSETRSSAFTSDVMRFIERTRAKRSARTISLVRASALTTSSKLAREFLMSTSAFFCFKGTHFFFSRVPEGCGYGLLTCSDEG